MIDNDQYMRNMTRYAFPQPEPVPDNPERFRRLWMTKVVTLLPPQDALAAKSTDLANLVNNGLLESYGAFATAEQLYRSRCDVNLVRGDDYHVIVEIILPNPDFRVGDALAIGTWLPLRAIDEWWQIDELEGIPKQFWFGLGGEKAISGV